MGTYYTIQTDDAWREAQNKGYLIGKREYVYDDWLKPYLWMISQMAKRVKEYNGEYPIWLWTTRPDLRRSAHLERGTKGVLLEMIIPEERVLLSDFQAWHLVLMDIPILSYEEENIDKEKSWERIFDFDYLMNDSEWGSIDLQGVTGKVSIDEIKLIKEFIAK